MQLVLIAASNRQPRWVDDAFEEYAKRLRSGSRLELKQISLARRGADRQRARLDEGRRMLGVIPDAAHVVALREQGRQWSTAELVERLRTWLELGAPVCFLVGGPDGLGDDCVERADEHWGLSRLTLPHGLARVAVAEALYRAWSVVQGHPYHRA
jgi:23S rRNA (pseudouridine1915-N3)-methyltransferase